MPTNRRIALVSAALVASRRGAAPGGELIRRAKIEPE